MSKDDIYSIRNDQVIFWLHRFSSIFGADARGNSVWIRDNFVVSSTGFPCPCYNVDKKWNSTTKYHQCNVRAAAGCTNVWRVTCSEQHSRKRYGFTDKVRVSWALIDSLSIAFTSNGKCEFVPRDRVSHWAVITSTHKLAVSRNFLSMSCFYLLIIWRLPYYSKLWSWVKTLMIKYTELNC